MATKIQSAEVVLRSNPPEPTIIEGAARGVLTHSQPVLRVGAESHQLELLYLRFQKPVDSVRVDSNVVFPSAFAEFRVIEVHSQDSAAALKSFEVVGVGHKPGL